MGTKPWAVLATQWRQGNSKQETFSHHREEVDLIVLDFVRIGVVGPLLIHLIEVNTHALD